MSLATIGLRNSFRRPVRTGLSVLGIALCVTLMLTSSSVSQRYSALIGQSYSIYRADIVVVSKASYLVGGIPLGGVMPQTTLGLVKGVKGVSSATPILVVVDVNQVVPSNITIGLPIQNMSLLEKAAAVQMEGSYPSTSDEVAVGAYLASTTGLTVGSTVREGGTTLRVSGVMHTSNLILSNALVMALQTAQSSQGYAGLVSAILVDVTGDLPGPVVGRIDSTVPSVRAVLRNQSQSLINPLASSIDSIGLGMDAVSALLGAILAAVIASVNIMEQVNEFLTIRAIGATRASVLAIVSVETGVVAATGLALGIVFSVLAIAGVFQSISSVPFTATISSALQLVPSDSVAVAAVVVIGSGLLSGAVTASSMLRRSE